MKIKEVVIILTGLSICSGILWILGLIQANMIYFVLSLIIVCLELPIAYQNKEELGYFFKQRNNKVLEDERSKFIDGQASSVSFGVTIATLIYTIIGIFTLRNVYPELLNTAILLIIILIISIISYYIGKRYYNDY